MAKIEMKNIFLSASVPLPERDPKYIETADIIAIRDAVISLATVALPHHRIVWGGHPSITPLIYYVMEKLKLKIQQHLTLYHSKFFEKYFLPDNNKFENVILTESTGERNSSLLVMRTKMFTDNQFAAGVFIGGMEGIEDEYRMFITYHDNALLLPVASTGAATRILYDTMLPDDFKNQRLEKDYAYMSLFQDLLINKI